MTLSIIVPNVTFPRRTQLYKIPALDRNHVFALFGASRDKSLINLNASQPNGIVTGEVEFSAEGLLTLGNSNGVRFKGFKTPNFAGVTMMVAFKTGARAGDAGLVSLWSEVAMAADSRTRRIFVSGNNGNANYMGIPELLTPLASRTLTPDTEYIMSLTRTIKGTTSQLRVHNSDGSVASFHGITEMTENTMPYATDVVFDVGRAANVAQIGAYVKSAALWSGIMTEAEIAAAAALMYQITHPA